MPRPDIATRACMLVMAVFLSACGGGGDGNGTPTVDAGTLPLMGASLRVGVVYSAPEPEVKATMDAAFAECIAAGADTYELSMMWQDLEATPGIVDTSALEAYLATIVSSGLRPYLVIKTIDTNRLTLPSDLMYSGDPKRFAAGLSFDSAVVLHRFAAVLDKVVPLLVRYDGFYLAVGNESDIWLSGNSAEKPRFITFVQQARSRAHLLNQRLAIGANCTYQVAMTDPAFLADLLAVSDAASFTYYPMNADFTVRDSALVEGDLAALVAAAAGKAVLLQEAGYPSGYNPGPNNGSTMIKQKEFVGHVFAALLAQPKIRYCSFNFMNDYTAAEVAFYQAYYGDSNRFHRLSIAW